MDHVSHEVVVALELLALKVGLDDCLVGEEHLGDTAVIAALHDGFNAHEGVSATKAYDSLSTCFDWVEDLPDRDIALLSHNSDCALTLFPCKDLCSICEHYQSALVNVLNDHDSIALSHLDPRISLRVYSLADADTFDFILDLIVSQLTMSADALRVSSGPGGSAAVRHGQGSIRKQDLEVAVLEVPHDLP